MSKLSFKSLKAGEILREHDQWFDKALRFGWYEIEERSEVNKNLCICHKITKKDLAPNNFKFCRPNLSSLAVIKNIKREIGIHQDWIAARYREIYE